jgi:CRP/FNR family cyclic AMP-dependent transcriptional regulator
MITMAGLLEEQPFFAGMRPVHLERLSYYARRATFRPDTQIFHEGGHAERFWLIREGLVQLHTHLPGRGQVTVETLRPGAVLGWSWLFPPFAWHFSAVAVEATLTVEFDGPAVQRLCDGSPELGYQLTKRFLNVVYERMQATRLRLIDVYGHV